MSAVSQLGVERNHICAIDIDKCCGPHDGLAIVFRGQDFVRWSLDTTQHFDRIVGNPPYIRLCRLEESLKNAALRVTEPDGSPMHLGVNYWHVFVCACLKILNPGGSLALVLPASWDYADYSAPLRCTLPKLFRSVVVHRSLRPLFGTVSDGSVVLIAKGYREQSEHYARHVHADLPALIKALEVGEHDLVSTGSQTEQEDAGEELVTLGDIADIVIGAVTGDAKYFLLTEQRRLEHKLPESCCKRILTRARQLRGGEVSLDDWRQLKDGGHRVWLFSPPDDLLANDAVHAYLELSTDKEGPNKEAYWLQKRDEWYRVELPLEAHGFMSGMRSTGPWMCMNRSPELTASNTLYIVRFREDITEGERYAWALSMLTSPVAAQSAQSCRLYADGLRKFEPSDLKRLRLPKPLRSEGARGAYVQAVSHLLSDGPVWAREIADQWFAVQSRLSDLALSREAQMDRVAESKGTYQTRLHEDGPVVATDIRS